MRFPSVLLSCCLLACLLPWGLAFGEYTPPGDYSDVGRVVRRADGSYDLFFGWGCPLQLPPALAARLEPYLGKMIRLDYTRVEEQEDSVFDPVGAPIGAFRKITVLPEARVEVTLALARPSFGFHEPVSATVTLRGDYAKTRKFEGAYDVEINLLRDYRSVLSFRPPTKRKPRPATTQPTVVQVHRKKPEPRAPEPPAPGGPLVLTLQSDKMVEPGTYEAVAIFDMLTDRRVLSKMVPVTIRAPADEEVETAALRAATRRTHGARPDRRATHGTGRPERCRLRRPASHG